MNRKAWKAQGTQSDDTVTVLRRRAKDLERDHYSPQYVSVFLRAADELYVRRRAATADEQLAVEAIADNRRLRHTLVEAFGQIRARLPQGWPDDVMKRIAGALAAVRPIGQGRRIMAIQIGTDQTRAEIEAIIAEVLDAHFRGVPDVQVEPQDPDAERDTAVDAAPERDRSPSGSAD